MKILDSRSSQSSFRFNQLLATIAALPIPLSIAFHIIWRTVKDKDISWVELGAFALSVAAYFAQLWYFKNQNKKTEVSAGEVSTHKEAPSSPEAPER